MMGSPRVLILRTAGTNCDQETAFAFAHFGAAVDFIHIKQLISGNVRLADYHILAIPGGFTYGDDIESGRLLANELRLYLKDAIEEFIAQKKLIIGICNGFQVLVKAGFLPGMKTHHGHQQATLVSNDSGKFEDRWVTLHVVGKSVWTAGLGERVTFPVAHAEGKFVVRDLPLIETLRDNQQIAFQYCSAQGKTPRYPENPNGSLGDIAGVTDTSGRVLGLMPHPERHFFSTHHPFWTRLKKRPGLAEGAKIFENGVNYVKKHF